MTDAFGVAADILDPYPEDVAMSHLDWCERELPQVFWLPMGPHHRWLLTRLGSRPSGIRAFAGAARGSGKTVTAEVGLPMAAIALGTHRFIVILGQNQTHAESRLEILFNEIDRSDDLRKRYPRLGIVSKTKKELKLRGGRIVALGAGESVRGLIRDVGGEIVRPDLVVGDDLETPEQARSKLRTDRLEEWVFADLAGLGGPGAVTAVDILLVGTTIDLDAMATRAMNRKGRFHTWDIGFFPAETTDEDGNRVATWPEGQPLEVLDALLDPESTTFIGRQTYSREYLLDPREVEGALWKPHWIDGFRILDRGLVPDMRRIVVAVDPSAGTQGDECGIVVAGLGFDSRGYVLDDRSVRASPAVWGAEVADAYHTWKADRIVAEVNFHAELVRLTMKTVDPGLTFKSLNATRGKRVRAEPVASLYELGRVAHVGVFPSLERQMLDWVPDESDWSPDRMDAVVWAITELMLGNAGPARTARTKARLP